MLFLENMPLRKKQVSHCLGGSEAAGAAVRASAAEDLEVLAAAAPEAVVLLEVGNFFINILVDLVQCYHGLMNREKFIIILLLVFSAFAIYYLDYWGGDIKAGMWAVGEKEFSEPKNVVWRGEIISTMAGGSCMGMYGEFDNYHWAVVCLPDTNSNELWKFEGVVTVTGKWLGITCAYKNTIFGECVPDVSIENIRQ